MDITRKIELAYQDDMGLEACAVRLRAAHHLTEISKHKDFADAAGISKTVLSNAMNGYTYPNREVLSYLYRAHRIDFNFMMLGLFAQLPGDVQAKIFPALELAKREWDQKENSDRADTTLPNAQPQT